MRTSYGAPRVMGKSRTLIFSTASTVPPRALSTGEHDCKGIGETKSCAETRSRFDHADQTLENHLLKKSMIADGGDDAWGMDRRGLKTPLTFTHRA